MHGHVSSIHIYIYMYIYLYIEVCTYLFVYVARQSICHSRVCYYWIVWCIGCLLGLVSCGSGRRVTWVVVKIIVHFWVP